uniref:ThuA domain-containing protein n=1 Tax=Georgenia wutianyii TaxID=2585135 RepID=UPI00143DAC75|nr:ThuA domain-containing protein [Georgenia wutianyii]
MVRRTNGGRWWARGASAALAAVLLAPLGMSGASAHDGEPHAEEDAEFSALVFSKTAGFRHGSIPAGVAAIQQLGEEHGFAVDHTEDSTAFTEENLANYDVVVWLSTTGDVLNDEQQGAFEQYIQDGGGYAGIHAASDTEYDWPWYGELVGAYFASHPPGTPNADVAVVDRVHPSTAHLPMRWNRTDEWYNYRENPRGDVHVLATLDETTYEPGNAAMGTDHPIAWCHDYDGGRSWYTGGGHTNESYSEPEFVQHILGGIRTAAGVEGADCAATVESSFEQVTLAKGGATIGEPIALAVLPNGDVLHTARDGRVFYTTADASTRTAATIPVYNHDEDGLQGIAIDPNFEENRWVYLYYAPPLDTPPGDAPETGPPSAYEPFEGHNSLSRFQLAEDGTLDLASEQEILRVEADRGICCHAGGEIDFDAEGNLYLSTGDDTNPFASDGYSPLDDRENRNPAFDGRRTSGNTNDLRGKLIRIDVMDEIADDAEPGPGSTYTVPEGNLFDSEEYDPELVREEIYAMGFRNPFRFAVDKETGWIHLGDYGPDAGAANADRGPGGQVEFNLIKEPGNFGWPFCHGDNDAYNDYDFAAGTSGPKFDCANLVNDSAHNTGLTNLPPAVPAWLPYDGGSEPQLGTGSESPMGGPTYRFDPELDSPTKWPEYFDGKTFNYEWGRGWIREFVTDDEGNLVDVVPSFEWLDLSWPMNVEFGPDGAMYILDYGQSWFGGDEFSALYRIDYVGQLNPVARIETSATSGPLPLTVEFDASTSTDPEDSDLTYEWDFDNDGTADATGVTVEHTFTDPGVHTVRLNVVAADGRVGTATVNITAGNTAPTVELEFPEDGSIFSFGDRIPFKVTVTDPEDGEIDCADVVVEYILGHDSHGHPLSRVSGCEGTIATAADDGHGLDADIFGIINVRYADQGGEGDVPSLTGDDEAMLRLRTQQAEFYDEAEGVNVFAKDGAAGGQQVGDIHNGDWIAFDPLNFVNIDGVSFRYTSGGAGGTLEVRQGSVDGHLAASVELGNTGGWEVWETSEVVELDALEGTGPVYFVFTGHETEALFDIDEIRYSGRGAADNIAPTVEAQATPTSGEAPLEVTFTATASDPDGDDVTLAWDFGDGSTGEGAEVTHTYTEPGTYTATVTATDAGGASSTATVTVTVDGPPSQCDEVAPSDEFDGSELDECRWQVVRPAPEHLRVVDGHLELDATPGDIYGGDNQTPANFVLQDLGDEDWTVETVVDMSETSQQYEQGGLIVHVDDDNYVKLDALTTNAAGSAVTRQVELRSEVGSVVQDPQPSSPQITATTVHLRLAKEGDTFTGSYSVDGGETWTAFPAVTNAGVAADGRTGLFALGAASTLEPTIRFDYFRVLGDEPPAEPVLIPVEKVSIGLYSLIPWVEAEGLPTVLARLAEIGLENIEPYGGNLTPYTAEQFRAMVDEIGLRVPSSHYNTAEDTFDDTLAYVETLGQEYVGSGGFAAPGIGTYENTLATAETMNRLGERSVAAGIGKFFGHNHAVEFTTMYEHNGEQMSAWEILVEETNPEFVTFQVDVAWATHGGVDVPALLEEYGDRIELLHIKDATNLGAAGGPSFTNLGEGDVPLQDILRAAEEHAEIAYYVMEYDVAPEGEDFVVTGFEYLTGLEAGEDGSRPVDVAPAAVTFTDEDGTEDDTYTVPWSVGVEYVVDGEVVAPGTYPGSGTVTVTAVVLDGFRLEEGATTEWTHTFSTGGGTPTDPVEGAQALADALEGYIASGDVAGPIAGQLTRALEQAVRHLEAGREAQAVRSMELFMRHLDNPKRPDTLDAAAQADLRSQVEVIIDLLG